MNEEAQEFRINTIKHNLRVRKICPDLIYVNEKKVTCDMCKELFKYKELRRVSTIGMICNKCYFK